MTPFDSVGNKCGAPNQGGFEPRPGGVNTTDLTEYKYKQFTGIVQAAGGSVEDLYDAVCVKECPKEQGELISCFRNKDTDC